MTRPCPLCGGSRGRVLFERGRYTGLDALHAEISTDLYGAFGRILRCRDCSFVFRGTEVGPEEVLKAYKDMADVGYLEEADCRSINAHLSLLTVKRHVREGRLLDVGCSSGFLLNAARLDFEPVGVEPSRWATELCLRRMGLPVAAETLAEASFPDNHFDVVTMVDVLEHALDPVPLVREAVRVLKPGGLFYVVTPDIGSFSARLLGRYWWGLRPAHFSYFSEGTLRKLLVGAGCRVREVRSYGRLFTYGYWLSRLRRYPGWVYRPIRRVIEALSWREKVAYINTRDSLEVCATKIGPGE